jgi:anti-anti-sigma factor
MNLKSERREGILAAMPQGRLDAFAAAELGRELDSLLSGDEAYLVLDMSGVPYLSSGGIRVLLGAHKKLSKKNGQLCICGLQEFPAQVLRMAGMDGLFATFSTGDEAARHISGRADMRRAEKDWRSLPAYHLDNASFHLYHASDRPARLKVVGNLMKVFHSALEEDDIRRRSFSEAEYSIGLGALGGSPGDCLPLLGEMMTIGGTMVWLPTDGNDTPDFLIPQKDTGEVVISAGLNMALDGEFNDIILMEAPAGGVPVTIGGIYEAVFEIARQRQAPDRAMVSVAMVSDLQALFSSGIRISPIREYAPANKGMITDPENIGQWMDVNTEPKFPGSTMISFGLGLDLAADRSKFAKDTLDNMFYLHPANIDSRKMMLHNHGVVFEKMGWRYTLELDSEIRRIAREGVFCDMRHLLDGTGVTGAVLGVSYITDILPE